MISNVYFKKNNWIKKNIVLSTDFTFLRVNQPGHDMKKNHVHCIMSISPWYTPIHGINKQSIPLNFSNTRAWLLWSHYNRVHFSQGFTINIPQLAYKDKKCDLFHDWMWILPWMKLISNELDVTLHMLVSQLSGHCDIIINRLWCHQLNINWASETQWWDMKIVNFNVIYGVAMSCKK